jgi:hypothetical protein
MGASSDRAILLSKSLEENNLGDSVLGAEARLEATRNAGITAIDTLDEDGRLRAGQYDRLGVRSGALLHLTAASGGDGVAYAELRRGGLAGKALAAGLLLAAFVLGASTNYLGRPGVISLIALPLLGLILWNLALYLILIIAKVRGTGQDEPGPMPQRMISWMKRSSEQRIDAMSAPFDKAARAFDADWWSTFGAFRARWLTLVAHGAAIMMVAGLLVGMYVRGVGQEYRAGWESTFVDAPALERFLLVALGPASKVTGIPVPPGKPLAELELPNPGEKANKWIHLFAATAVIFVLLPRALLVIAEFVAIGRLRKRIVRGDPFARYYRRICLAAGGSGQLVRVFPYHCRLEPRNRDAVRSLIHGLWGGAAHVDFADSTAYGGEEELVDNLESLPGYVVLLMSLSATPEGEAHGYLIREMQKRADREGEGSRILVLVDENRFRSKFGGLGEFERRLEERRKAWRELAEPLGIRVAPFNSEDQGSAGDVIDAADQFVWSAG